MTQRVHQMPFGCELQGDGRARFRLWATATRQVELCLEAARTHHRMRALDDGWFELICEASTGDLYRFRIDGGLQVPDPASRFNPHDVHGPSAIVDPAEFVWDDEHWRGRPWHEAVIYELHVGAFSAQGGFAGVEQRLDYLFDLGVTAIELMPVADFPGSRNWGYDGVLAFAPEASYGTPDALKRLVASAHRRGLMVLLDVVYNHFGPDGNYLHAYASQFFNQRLHTPWGAGIDFERAQVQDFFVHNALYWLEEFHFDGLRLDAVHAIAQPSRDRFLERLALAVQRGPGEQRQVHLVLENDENEAHLLEGETHVREGAQREAGYRAQWNDDLHHALHVLSTGETRGHFADYSEQPLWHLGRCLSSGFSFQGQPSAYRDQRPRGESTQGIALSAFVGFLQNHDQIGNRPFGDRLGMLIDPRRLQLLIACLLLMPSVPLLFMGEEFAAQTPFLFFCDFGGELGRAVNEGRRKDFAHLLHSATGEWIDAGSEEAFARSKLDWSELERADQRAMLQRYRDLLALRREQLMPVLDARPQRKSEYRVLGMQGLHVRWDFDATAKLDLLANFTSEPMTLDMQPPPGRLLHSVGCAHADAAQGRLPPWAALWYLDREAAAA